MSFCQHGVFAGQIDVIGLQDDCFVVMITGLGLAWLLGALGRYRCINLQENYPRGPSFLNRPVKLSSKQNFPYWKNAISAGIAWLLTIVSIFLVILVCVASKSIQGCQLISALVLEVMRSLGWLLCLVIHRFLSPKGISGGVIGWGLSQFVSGIFHPQPCYSLVRSKLLYRRRQ